MEGNGGVNVEMSMVTMVIVEYCLYIYIDYRHGPIENPLTMEVSMHRL